MKIRIPKGNDRGNGLLITMILVLVMMVIIVGSLSIAGLQSDISNIDKEVSNTYTLAKSAVDKTVDNINKEIELATYDIMDEVRKKTLTELKNDLSTVSSSNTYASTYFEEFVYKRTTEGGGLANLEKNFGSSANKILYKDDDGSILRTLILEEIKKKVLYDEGGNPKVLTYTVNSDYTFDTKNQANPGSQTRVTVTIAQDGANLDQYKIKAIAEVLDATGGVIENLQEVEAIVEISLPDRIDAYLTERYKWFDDNHPAEVLSGAIISYVPITLAEDDTLNIRNGDMKVTGELMKKVKTSAIDEAVSLEGAGEGVAVAAELQFPLPKDYKGVEVQQGANLKIVDGNLYCLSNVASTGGIIDVDKDVVADTIGIFDKFYPDKMTASSLEPWRDLVTGSITIGKNAYVDNDVVIERYTNNATIEVGGSIFGIMDGDKSNPDILGGATAILDPNRSSGVFNRGEGASSLISAKNILVHGQPFITFRDGNGFHALYESIGEPFEEVYKIDEYRTIENGDTPSYISDDRYKSFIKTNKISYENKLFAPEYISANGETKKKNDLNPSNETDMTVALPFFYRGCAWSSVPSDISSAFSEYQVLWNDYVEYFAAIPDKFKGQPDFYAKKIAPSGTKYNETEYFGGVRAIMTAKRSPLYGMFKDAEFLALTFDQATNLEYLKAHAWSVANPVLVKTASGTVNISDFYVKDNPYPTVIVSTGALTLTSNGSHNHFHGIIVSKEKVTIDGNINVTGTMVLGGGLDLGKNTLSVTYDPDMIFKVDCADKEIFRYILDSLNITNFLKSKGNLVNALNAYKYTQESATEDVNKLLPYEYTMPRVMLTDMNLTVETQDIAAKIKEIKKIEN